MEKVESKECALEIVKFLDDKKAENIIVIDIEEISGFTDYFIIASCNSFTQINVLAKSIKSMFSEKGIDMINSLSTGKESTWIILDFQDFIVHLFLKDTREFYQIEKLWHEGKVIYPSSEHVLAN